MKSHIGIALFMIMAGLGLVIFQGTASASWAIDLNRFHVSVHGAMSCLDCHEDQATPAHPDPALANRSLSNFFSERQCTACHDGSDDFLASGKHGGMAVTSRDQAADCLACHNPHYQLSRETASTLDLERPLSRQCGRCHDAENQLPESDPDALTCLGCHGRSGLESDPAETRLCLHCHGMEASVTGIFPRIDAAAIQSGPHGDTGCTACHVRAAAFNHDGQGRAHCGTCHTRHPEKWTHDAHARVSCQACHMAGIIPFRDPETGSVVGRVAPAPAVGLTIHELIPPGDKALCQRCHVKGNRIGASASVLPAKSVICLPCHAATLSAGDPVSVAAIIIFFAGLGSIFLMALSGRSNELLAKHRTMKTGPGRRLAALIEAILMDVIGQRRLYRRSRARWFIHQLIFFPFVIRFGWGLVALAGSYWWPGWAGSWGMLDKNNPVTALLFDLTGLMVVCGAAAAIIRSVIYRRRKIPGLPPKDWPALGLLAGMMLSGFGVEAWRMAMTGWPDGSEYALVGYGLSLLFGRPESLTGGYEYIWYGHAVIVAGFVAYLPFSRMRHIILAPLLFITGKKGRRWIP